MTRLTSIEKGGYYAFPDEHLPALASLFAPAKHGGKFLDPCAGEGRALDHITKVWNVTPYANELDDTRAAACATLFGKTQAVHGDMYALKASGGAFIGAWCNPPYSWDKTGDEKRREFGMLKHTVKWVQPDGFLLWCVYAHHITHETASYLAKHSSSVDVWRLPGLHLSSYTHVVAVSRLGKSDGDPARRAIEIVEAGERGDWRELTVQDAPLYEFPAPLTRKTFVFAPKQISPDLALQFVREVGVQSHAGIEALITPEPPPAKIQPVVRPRGGQLALILAAGLFNGLILNTEGGSVAVRSTVQSVEVQTEEAGEIDEDERCAAEREVYRTQSVVTITLLGEDGSVDDISGDAAIARFIKDHKPALLAYLDEHFAPLYNFDYSPLAEVLARPKRGKLYPTQKHVIAACWTALQYRKSVILVGEPGSGKSIMGGTVAVSMGAAVAAAVGTRIQPGQVTVIMCPPHLVEKWEREIRDTGANVYVKILKNVGDVRTFMDTAARHKTNTLNVAILSRETAKLGEGWSVAVNTRRVRHVRWAHNTPRPTRENGLPLDGDRVVTLEVPVCPTCGKTLEEGGDVSHRERRGVRKTPAHREATSLHPAVAPAWLERVPRYCPHCNGALWTKSRTFSKGKRVNGNPVNPRTPLAEYIAKHYKDRLYLYIADELHELKSAATDQSEAMTLLANAATKTLGLTGTLYGGCGAL
jgi:hypothetical protein